jgi:hypothetical protein
MPRALRLTLICAAAVIALAALAVGGIEWQERRFASSVAGIELGASREVVLERLGKPQSEGGHCYVAQFVKFEKPAPRPVAHHCVHWIGPSPVFGFYAVGFNTNNTVVWVAYGDS